MSPRNDAFLSHCLAQASLSPLHYRHGSIIVRGGKVIGQGFNTFRSGFDGGALKTGTLPSGAVDGPAIAKLKQRSKLKSNQKHKQESINFTPFEVSYSAATGIQPLSMHSEMMAIISALSLSSGALSSQVSARANKCLQKPHLSAPGGSKKRKERARALKAYAEVVCQEVQISSTGQSYAGKFSVQKSRFEPSASQPGRGAQQVQRQQGEGGEESKEAFKEEELAPASSWMCCQQKICNGLQAPKNLIKSTTGGKAPRSSSANFTSFQHGKPKHSKKSSASASASPTSEHTLALKRKALHSKPSIAERTKDLRLKGSDLYVARLGSCTTSKSRPITALKDSPSSPSTPSSIPPSSPTTAAAAPPPSLYDELSARSRNASTPATAPSTQPPPSSPRSSSSGSSSTITTPLPQIRASRPCYRCIDAMHAAGIKRVFWTTQRGTTWQGAKVRDLVEALEMGGWEDESSSSRHHSDGAAGGGDGGGGSRSSAERRGGDINSSGGGAFVTKHEVLMLKRMADAAAAAAA